MKKQEVIDEIENAIPDYILNDYQRGKETGLTYALELVKELDEPEKPVLSKEEAEWLEGLIKFVKSCGQSIYNTLYYITRQGYGYLFEYIDHDKDKSFILSNRIYPRELYPDDLKERFVNALLYGYEVEKEKLYTVEIPNPHGLGHTVLVKDMYGNIFITYVMNSDWRKSKVNQLTEAEIKKDFDWAWRFVEEVKE